MNRVGVSEKKVKPLDQTGEGFAQVLNRVSRDSKLSPQARHLYSVIVSYCWQDGECRVGQARLARDMGRSSRSIREYLRELTEAELIEIRRRGLTATKVIRLLVGRGLPLLSGNGFPVKNGSGPPTTKNQPYQDSVNEERAYGFIDGGRTGSDASSTTLTVPSNHPPRAFGRWAEWEPSDDWSPAQRSWLRWHLEFLEHEGWSDAWRLRDEVSTECRLVFEQKGYPPTEETVRLALIQARRNEGDRRQERYEDEKAERRGEMALAEHGRWRGDPPSPEFYAFLSRFGRDPDEGVS